MRVAINGAVIQNNRILLVRKKQTWIFPGGKPKEGESELECLFREFREDLPFLKIKKTKGNRILKDAVCDSPLFLGCSELKTTSDYRTLKCAVFNSDIKNPIFYKKFEGITPHTGDCLESRVYFLDAEGEPRPAAEILEARWLAFNNIKDYQVSEISIKVLESLKKEGYL